MTAPQPSLLAALRYYRDAAYAEPDISFPTTWVGSSVKTGLMQQLGQNVHVIVPGNGCGLLPHKAHLSQTHLTDLTASTPKVGFFYGYPMWLRTVPKANNGVVGAPLLLQAAEFAGANQGPQQTVIVNDLVDEVFLNDGVADELGWNNDQAAQVRTTIAGCSDPTNIHAVVDALNGLFASADGPHAPNGWADVDPLHTATSNSIPSAGTLANSHGLFICHTPNYTAGLKRELDKIVDHVARGGRVGQALEHLLTRQGGATNGPTAAIRYLSQNEEQVAAVTAALSEPMTVVTGPPGTGKSQVAANVVLNQATRSRPVLVASRNNKAVDVLTTRVNALHRGPDVLLRTGGGARASVGTTAATIAQQTFPRGSSQQHTLTDPHDAAEAAAEAAHAASEQTAALDRLRDTLLAARTAVEDHPDATDDLEAALEGVTVDDMLVDVVTAGLAAARQDAPNVFKWFRRPTRHDAVKAAADALQQLPQDVRADLTAPAGDEPPYAWEPYLAAAAQRVRAVELVKTVHTAEEQLASTPTVSALAADANRLEQKAELAAATALKAWVSHRGAAATQSVRAATQSLVRNYGKRGRRPFLASMQAFEKALPALPAWAVTNLSTASSIPFTPNLFDLVLIDEASQCDIASAIPLLFRARRATIIGDPQQLTHISNLSPHEDERLLATHNLPHDFSYRDTSLYDLAATTPCELVDLVEHHRSHARIAQFSNHAFYSGRLQIVTNYHNLNTAAGQGTTWHSTTGTSASRAPNGQSLINDKEAKQVVARVNALLGNSRFTGSNGTVGVVTPFRAQADHIAKLLRAKVGAVTVGTVHTFQGDERDVMLFSTVVTDGAPTSTVRFLANRGNLLNVAVTRARASLEVFGDDQFLAATPDLSLYAQFATHARTPATPPTSTGTPANKWEQRLYDALTTPEAMQQHGRKVVVQHPLGPFRIDLALIDPNGTAPTIGIEVDGVAYHTGADGNPSHRDLLRDRIILARGIDLHRYWVPDIARNLEHISNEIIELCQTVTPAQQ